MAKYLQHVESDFDRQELRYLELIDIFGVSGVHTRLRALREALANNESPSVIAQKRTFLDMKNECLHPVPRHNIAGRSQKTKIPDWSNLKQSSLPIRSDMPFLLLDQK